MSRSRAVWRLARTVLHVLHGLAVVLLRFPQLDRAARQARIRWWSAKTLRLMGIGADVRGAFKPGAKLIVANHVSWLDILALHSVCPEARFVSKAEVGRWPLVGRLVDAAETLYLEREKKRDALRVVHRIADALREGGTVAAFPEGTTGDGHALLPFHANLLQAAIATATPVQPVALRYADAANAVSPAAAWLGETTLAASLWSLVRAEGLVVRVRVLPPMATAHADRRRLAEHLHGLIAEALPS